MFKWIKKLFGKKKEPLVLTDPTEEVKVAESPKAPTPTKPKSTKPKTKAKTKSTRKTVQKATKKPALKKYKEEELMVLSKDAISELAIERGFTVDKRKTRANLVRDFLKNQ